jgi:hypothetical protein
MGPSVSDPRTGEIIESDIIWYHNHLRSYRNRFLVETAASNPKARTLETSEEDIGEMMEMVISHEVGHALGFPHNMGASSSYEVEDYRNAEFTKTHGISATIMDYARFNYIAQPEDKGVRYIRKMGPYDDYAVNWGYRILPNSVKPEDEVATLNQWIEAKAGDLRFRFGNQGTTFDPSSQTEDIGNDPVRAGNYAMKNLKVVAKNLADWTSRKTNNYDDLIELNDELLTAWFRYVGHVVTSVGGYYERYSKPNQQVASYIVVPKAKQQSATKWLLEHAFSDVAWLINKEVVTHQMMGYNEKIRVLQVTHLNDLLSFETLARLDNSSHFETNYYKSVEFCKDLRVGLWSELASGAKLEVFRRNLQKAYIERMKYLLTEQMVPSPTNREYYSVVQSDVRSTVRGELKALLASIKLAKIKYKDTETLYHLEDCIDRIQTILYPGKQSK